LWSISTKTHIFNISVDKIALLLKEESPLFTTACYPSDAHGLECDDSLDDPRSKALIDAIFKSYGHMSGEKLSALTHLPETPWSETWEKDQFGIITNDRISKYYEEIWNEHS